MSNLQGRSFSIKQSYQMFCIAQIWMLQLFLSSSPGNLCRAAEVLHAKTEQQIGFRQLFDMEWLTERLSLTKKTKQTIVCTIHSFSKNLCLFLAMAMASDHFSFSYFSFVSSRYLQLFNLHSKACCLLTLIAGFRHSCVDALHPAVLSALRLRSTRGLLSRWAVDACPRGFILHDPSCCQMMVSYIFCCSSAPLSTLWVRVSVCVAGVSLLVVHLRVCFFALWYKYHTLLDITGVCLFQFPDTPDLRIRRRQTPGIVAVQLLKLQMPADIMGYLSAADLTRRWQQTVLQTRNGKLLALQQSLTEPRLYDKHHPPPSPAEDALLVLLIHIYHPAEGKWCRISASPFLPHRSAVLLLPEWGGLINDDRWASPRGTGAVGLKGGRMCRTLGGSAPSHIGCKINCPWWGAIMERWWI